MHARQKCARSFCFLQAGLDSAFLQFSRDVVTDSGLFCGANWMRRARNLLQMRLNSACRELRFRSAGGKSRRARILSQAKRGGGPVADREQRPALFARIAQGIATVAQRAAGIEGIDIALVQGHVPAFGKHPLARDIGA